MDLFRLLTNGQQIFAIDDVEDKKTKVLLKEINSQLETIVTKLRETNDFLVSQLEGEYHTKIVKAKSLQQHFTSWNTINMICNNFEKEEKKQINKFNSFKNQLIINLKTLLSESKKLPVVCLFDIINNEFVYVKKGHNVIVLGNNNSIVIEYLIRELEENLIIGETFNRVTPIELKANYINVEKNTETCTAQINQLFDNKPSKAKKLLTIVEAMEAAAKDLTFFVTYKEELVSVGCSTKDISIFEKELLKKYVPLKKQLSKLLKVEFVDVCDIVVDENDDSMSDWDDFDLNDFDAE